MATIDGDAFVSNGYLVFLCAFDPFRKGLPIYTYVATCRENGIELEDGQARIFASIPHWELCTDEKLRDLLCYFGTGKIGGDRFLRQIDEAVRDVRSRPAWRESYMRYEVRLMEKYAKGRADERDAAKRLLAALRQAGRADELLDAVEDDALYERLLSEFSIDFGNGEPTMTDS